MPDHRALHHFMGALLRARERFVAVVGSSLLSAGSETPAQLAGGNMAVEVERARQGQAQLRLILSHSASSSSRVLMGLRMLSWAFRSACGRRGAVQLRAPRPALPAMTMSPVLFGRPGQAVVARRPGRRRAGSS
ncbi:hypothetical protein ACFFX0_33065 [Citricoccus parietis]|uniref:Uncharacterized protein n=1 Tax=Citricoccus parietis TaxID=592307 RepID=A0ABV5G9V4_9MICC